HPPCALSHLTIQPQMFSFKQVKRIDLKRYYSTKHLAAFVQLRFLTTQTFFRKSLSFSACFQIFKEH
ncbi:hypothetical protein, partial [Mannheimia varigena]|uniref:hypothetical protein n=1 Tax=Mannheimia varigena TaxID=85404 RepID=UPI001BB29CB1